MLLWWFFEDFSPWRKSFYTYIGANEISIDCCVLQLVVVAESFIDSIHNYFYLSHSNIGNIYLMYIHLPGRHYNVNLLHPQTLLSEQSLQVCPYFVFLQLLCLTSPGCLYRLDFISFTLRQVVSGLPGRLFSVDRSF